MIEISQLKQIRRLLNITQSDFARIAKVSQSMIAKIESGSIDPSYSNVKKISEAIERMKHDNEPAVKEIMVKKVISVNTRDLLKDAIRIFNKYGISQIPVMKGGNIAGILYESTLLEKATEPDFAKLTAEEAMVEAPPTVSEDTKVSAVSNLLKYFPVVLVTKKGDLTGIVTKADILKSLI
ncbi:MAG: CBS domain-containing protein [Candidatus Nanoarchaeia archaeon]|nr:CBS domain-containing protein [Candidatus Nanoarchaeia archaeon]